MIPTLRVSLLPRCPLPRASSSLTAQATGSALAGPHRAVRSSTAVTEHRRSEGRRDFPTQSVTIQGLPPRRTVSCFRALSAGPQHAASYRLVHLWAWHALETPEPAPRLLMVSGPFPRVSDGITSWVSCWPRLPVPGGVPTTSPP